MGRAPCCSKVGLHRGPWTPREDTLLTKYIQTHGEGHWRSLPKKAGLLRCGKSCRLRWMNYLRPDIKRGNISPDEDDLIIRLHSLLGNRWSLIAGRLPGRTDNEIKNYWNTHLSKKLISQGTDPNTHKKLSPASIPDKKKKPTRPNNNNNKNKKLRTSDVMKNKGKAVEPPRKNHKIHQPKPTRVTSLPILPRIDSFESKNTVSGSSSHGGENGTLLDHSLDDLNANRNNVHAWDGENGIVGFYVGVDDDSHGHGHDDGHRMFNGSGDLECQSFVPAMGDSTLEKLYEEYFQLLKNEEDNKLQLDSFAESLLISRQIIIVL